MPVTIPITPTPARRFEAELNKVRLFFTLKWNSAALLWFFDLEDSNGFLFRGMPMAGGDNIIATQTDLVSRIGELWMVDLSGNSGEATVDNLGSTVVLLHFTPGEVVDIPAILGEQ